MKGKPLKLKHGMSLIGANLKNVEDLMDIESNNWNSSLIWALIKMELAIRILGTYIPQNRNRDDEIVWSRNPTGKINSKDACSLLSEDCKARENIVLNRKFWGQLWSMKI